MFNSLAKWAENCLGKGPMKSADVLFDQLTCQEATDMAEEISLRLGPDFTTSMDFADDRGLGNLLMVRYKDEPMLKYKRFDRGYMSKERPREVEKEALIDIMVRAIRMATS